MKLAKHRETGVAYALKIFRGEDTVEGDFQQELCIGCRLQHQNLVKFFGGVEGKEVAIAMER